MIISTLRTSRMLLTRTMSRCSLKIENLIQKMNEMYFSMNISLRRKSRMKINCVNRLHIYSVSVILNFLSQMWMSSQITTFVLSDEMSLRNELTKRKNVQVWNGNSTMEMLTSLEIDLLECNIKFIHLHLSA